MEISGYNLTTSHSGVIISQCLQAGGGGGGVCLSAPWLRLVMLFLQCYATHQAGSPGHSPHWSVQTDQDNSVVELPHLALCVSLSPWCWYGVRLTQGDPCIAVIVMREKSKPVCDCLTLPCLSYSGGAVHSCTPPHYSHCLTPSDSHTPILTWTQNTCLPSACLPSYLQSYITTRIINLTRPN